MRSILCLLFCLISFVVKLKAQSEYKQYLALSSKILDSLYQNSKSPKERHPYALARYNKRKKEQSEKDNEYFQNFLELAISYQTLGEYAASIDLLKEEKDVVEQLENQKTYSYLLDELAKAYYLNGDYEEAKKYFLEELNLNKANGWDYSDAMRNVGTIYILLGDYKEAEATYLKTIKLVKETYGENNIRYAYVVGNLGSLYNTLGYHKKAESFFLEDLRIIKALKGAKDPEYATTLMNLGILYKKIKEFEKAEAYYQEALGVNKEVWGEDHPKYIGVLINSGNLYKEMKSDSLAEKTYLQALAIQEKTLGKEHARYILTLNNLATLYLDMKDYELSNKLYQEVLQKRKELLGETHPLYLASLNSFAKLKIKMGDYPQAWESLLKVLNLNTAITLEPNIDQLWLNNLSKANFISYTEADYSLLYVYELLKKEQKQKEQLFIINLALKLLERTKNEMSEETDKLRILEKRKKWLLKAFHLDTENAELFYLLEQNKSVLLLDALNAKDADLTGLLPKELLAERKELEKEYTATKAALIAQANSSRQDSIRSAFTKLNLRIDDFKRKLERNYPQYAAMYYQTKPIELETFQKELNPGTALIEYLIAKDQLYILYIDENNTELYKQAIDADSLEQKINNFHQLLSNYKGLSSTNTANTKQEYVEYAHWFYQQLLHPVLKEKKGIKDLRIVTDGILGHLPFESFLVEKQEDNLPLNKLHFVLKDYTISYNYAASLWLQHKNMKQKKHNGQLLGIAANYNIQADSFSAEWRSFGDLQLREYLDPLPAARREVEALQNSVKGFFAFDSLASERLFKNQASNYGIIHLAMHGLLDKQSPALSSLAFTDVSDSLEDNFLQAYEISKMELNADLVVLSACETGYGRFETGNGIASLARAFMYAGVPSLVVSLWQVNDQSTSIIMQNFYKHLASGMSKSAALRQAKLDYIETVKSPIAAHPAFWSPFILIGDESPVKLQRKGAGAWIWWGIGASALLLAGLGFGLARRKKAA